MKKIIIKCPKCEGQNIHIMEYMSYKQYYYIEDKKIYRNNKTNSIPTGKLILSCETCAQKSEEGDPSWKPNIEEIRVINDMLMETRSADVSKYMDE